MPHAVLNMALVHCYLQDQCRREMFAGHAFHSKHPCMLNRVRSTALVSAGSVSGPSAPCCAEHAILCCLQDQCRREMFAGNAFRYVREAAITFRPTYKFDKHTADPMGYDSSEKRRVPAWTDRIFFRGSAFIKNALEVHVTSPPSPSTAMIPLVHVKHPNWHVGWPCLSHLGFLTSHLLVHAVLSLARGLL